MLIDDSVGVYEISPKGRNQHDQIQPPIKVNQNQPSVKVNKKLPPSRKLDFEHSETNELLRVDGALNQEDVEVVEPNKEITSRLNAIYSYEYSPSTQRFLYKATTNNSVRSYFYPATAIVWTQNQQPYLLQEMTIGGKIFLLSQRQIEYTRLILLVMVIPKNQIPGILMQTLSTPSKHGQHS
ncbi:hypothetical protein KSP40_PGU005590 [Platanthera guangdongensis]|uniref:Uncharacterized protein n=1 Tax=Platanthera guangdongensis TaxID=2320717 RepID=A0ABR2MCB1_9ASPA